MNGKLLRRLGFLMISVLAILVFSQGIWLWQQLKKEKQTFSKKLETSLNGMVNFHTLQGYRNYPKSNPNKASVSMNSRPQKNTHVLAKHNINTEKYIHNFSLLKTIQAAFTDKSLKRRKVKVKIIDSLFRNNFDHLEKIQSYHMQLIKNDTVIDSSRNGEQIDYNSINSNRLLELSIPMGTKEIYKFTAQFELRTFPFLREMVFSISVSGIAVILVAIFMYWLLWALSQRVNQLQWREQSVRGIVHDLKSPLSYVYTLLEYISTKDLETHIQKQIKSAGNNVFKLNQKLELILNLFSGENKKLVMEPCKYNLLERCKEILSELTVIYLEKQPTCEFNISDSLQIHVDPYYFEAALRNLIDNALKYSNVPAKITISANTQQNNLELAIRDSGVGIPKLQQKKIFNEFYRLKSNSKGYGIGLAFSNQIIQAHKGSIKLKSELGKGSTFYIALPAKSIINS